MRRRIQVLAAVAVLAALYPVAHAETRALTDAPLQLITLDPGHFHAALVQKLMYPGVSPVVHVYAPAGDDLEEHLKRIERFNRRSDDPTHWETVLHTGPAFFDDMLRERAGGIVVIAGNNRRKTEYIERSIEAGFHVLADKPMAITPEGFAQLRQAFVTAEMHGLLLYDIMTERFEITTVLQRELSRRSEVFGALVAGSADEPAIVKESVHHFSKVVAGAPLKRPPWFFDVLQEGEGIVDVTTHLVDLIQWEAFPEQVVHPDDVTMLEARRWATPITPAQFGKVTGAAEFPDYLRGDVKDDTLQVYCNGSFTYALRGVHARVSVTWAFEAPAGAGDTHYSIMRGTRANLVIRQGATEGYKPALHVEPAAGVTAEEIEGALRTAIENLAATKYAGLGLRSEGDGFVVTVPAALHVGHEAHFAQVTENFLGFIRAGKMPAWEVPNMITKHHTIMEAYAMAMGGGGH